MKNKIILISAVLFAICNTVPLACFAQDGSLDLSFDTDGIVTTPIANADDFGQAIAIQTDGKIVAAGYSANSITGSDFALARYLSNGILDNTFDTDGKVTKAIGTSSSRAHAIAIQNDGKIIVAGYSYTPSAGNDFTLARFNSNGSLDTTFDADGIVVTPMGGSTNDRAFSIALQNDGKILVAGYHTDLNTTQRDFVLVRYTTNGSLDNTFGSTGIVGLSIAAGDDEARSISIQNDGKIVVAGYSFNFSSRVFALLRYNSNGSLDTSFDTDGIVTTPIGTVPTDDAAYSVAIQSDGKIVVAGYSHGATYDFAVVRYDTSGTLDTSFDTDGIVITSVGTSATSADEAHGITIQNDGKILVSGHADYDFALVRYTTNGSLDNSFDTDGIVITDITPPLFYDKIEAMALQTDSKIVIAGYSNNGTTYDFTIARYNNTSGTGVNLATLDNSEIDIYPNPFSTSVTIHSDNVLENACLSIYTLHGQPVKDLFNCSGQVITFSRDNLPSGLYFMQLTQDNKILARNKLAIAD